MNWNINDENIIRSNCPLGTFSIKIIEEDTNRQITIYATTSPHANCQTFSIAYFYYLFNYSVDNKIEILKKIWNKCSGGKHQLLLDVNDKYIADIESLFEGDVIFTQRYKSTNQSLMAIMLINVNKLKP